jgi:hypothetical protein
MKQSFHRTYFGNIEHIKSNTGTGARSPVISQGSARIRYCPGTSSSIAPGLGGYHGDH